MLLNTLLVYYKDFSVYCKREIYLKMWCFLMVMPVTFDMFVWIIVYCSIVFLFHIDFILFNFHCLLFYFFFIFSRHSLDVNSEIAGHMLKETLIAYFKWFAISLQVCGRDFRNGIYDYSYSNSSNIHHSLNYEHFTEEKKTYFNKGLNRLTRWTKKF
jgi:hypothetical protein